MQSTAKRLPELDLLRSAAILVVLVHHSQIFLGEIPLKIGTALVVNGWCGVDLFFVLSGFLVSGLLFDEYTRFETLHVSRFLVRRAFKIYPPMWVFLACGLCIKAARNMPPSLLIFKSLPDILLVDDYIHGFWIHFWSLSVEEHFYVLLPFLLLLMVRLRKRNPETVFRPLIWLVPTTAFSCLLLRFGNVYGFQYLPYPFSYSATHFRIDELMWGVLLAYLFHFEAATFKRVASKHRTWLFAIGLFLLSPLLFADQRNPLVIVFSLGLNGIAFFLILAATLGAPVFLSVTKHPLLRPGFRGLLLIGRCSYAIYLWHPMVANAADIWHKKLSTVMPDWALAAGYVCISIVLGYILTKVVEVPALAIRERMFSRTQGTLVRTRLSREQTEAVSQ